jgi:hypothetical protein
MRDYFEPRPSSQRGSTFAPIPLQHNFISLLRAPHRNGAAAGNKRFEFSRPFSAVAFLFTLALRVDNQHHRASATAYTHSRCSLTLTGFLVIICKKSRALEHISNVTLPAGAVKKEALASGTGFRVSCYAWYGRVEAVNCFIVECVRAEGVCCQSLMSLS